MIVVVDILGRELWFKSMPVREIDTDFMTSYHGWFDKHDNSWGTELPKGTIKKLIGRDLTWEDEPVEVIDHSVEQNLYLINLISKK